MHSVLGICAVPNVQVVVLGSELWPIVLLLP